MGRGGERRIMGKLEEDPQNRLQPNVCLYLPILIGCVDD